MKRIAIEPNLFRLSCPRCHSQDIRRSHRRPLEVTLNRFVTFVPYHCEVCQYRFFHFPSRFLFRTLKVTGAILAGVVLVGFLAFHWLASPKEGKAAPATRAASTLQTRVSAPSGSVTTPPARTGKRSLLTPTLSVPVAGTIAMRGESKFRVNWDQTRDGLTVTRIADGPMKRAGLRVGDRLVSVDGQALVDEEILLAARDAVARGKLASARLIVRRDRRSLVYELLP